MLNTQQVYFNLLQFHIASCFNFLPIQVDRARGKVRLVPDNKIWRLFYWLSCSRWIFAVSKGLQSIFSPVDLIDSPAHVVLSVGLAHVVLIMHICFIKYPELAALSFNTLLESGGSLIVSTKTKNKRLNVQELVVVLLPLNSFIFPLLWLMLMLIGPKAQFFLYGSLGPTFQTPMVFYTLCWVEMFLFTFMVVNITFWHFILALFFERCNIIIKDGIRKLEICHSKDMLPSVRMWKVAAACTHCRKIQLLLQYFNTCFSYTVFTFKIYSICGSIAMTSFGILLTKTKLPIALAYLVAGMQAICVFAIIFQKAFTVPAGMRKYKNKILQIVKLYKLQIPREDFARRVRSIHNTGIAVGIFQKLQRSSTPVFLDFITRSIARVLIAFRYH
ncbi:unnamed protein product [Allacma fusca]|uniref:Uncharacterized protein n=1 Tax=Allacma fusca TaxID=39272 RepID=A0A8J2PDV6_9HEXA|nr:unnamed protein product [Allacma fusca]